MEVNNECSRKYNSGWWFAYGLKYDSDTRSTKEICEFDVKRDTNLNGEFDYDHRKNQRQIAFCSKPKIEDCVSPHKARTYIDGWQYQNITTIKLSVTEMWLKRK